MPPRWFWYVIALAALLVAGGVAGRAWPRDRWVLRDSLLYNERTGQVCTFLQNPESQPYILCVGSPDNPETVRAWSPSLRGLPRP